MIIEIPRSDVKEWRGIFSGKSSGELWQTWNIDLERVPGRICLSGRGGLVQESDSDLTFSAPYKFLKTNADGASRYWAVCKGLKLIKSSDSTPTSVWISDTIANSPASVVNDFIVHGDSDHSDTDESDRLLVFINNDTGGDIAILNRITDTNITSLHSWDTDFWTGSAVSGGLAQTKLNGLVDHPCGRLQTLVGFCDGNKFHTIDKNDIPVYNRISFPIGYNGICVYSSTTRFWIGLKPTVGNNGMIVEWDGSTENYNHDYKIEGVPIAGWVKDNIPYFINHYGQILKYTGESFEEVKIGDMSVRFPMIEQGIFFETSATSGDATIRIYGCAVDGDLVKILVGSPNTSIRMRAGIWTFNTKNNNLYHSQSLSAYSDLNDSSGADSDAVQTDFGQGVLAIPGGLINTKGDITGRLATATNLLAGATYYKAYSGTVSAGIFKFYFNGGKGYPCNPTARGYFVTPYISSDAVSNFWSNIWAVFKKFVHNDNKIIVKFRTEEPFIDRDANASQCQITWVTKTTFKGAIPTGVVIGNEVEIIAGRNSGCCFHISNLSGTPNGTTIFTVTIDESVPYGSDTAPDTSLAQAVFDNWVKSDVVSDTTVEFNNFPLSGADSDGNALNNGPSVQFKVELRGKAMEVEKLIAVTKEAVTPE